MAKMGGWMSFLGFCVPCSDGNESLYGKAHGHNVVTAPRNPPITCADEAPPQQRRRHRRAGPRGAPRRRARLRRTGGRRASRAAIRRQPHGHLGTRRPSRTARRGSLRRSRHPSGLRPAGLLRVVPEARWPSASMPVANLGADVHYSGTVAAVREAVLHGWPGIAFSQYLRDHSALDWQRATSWAARVLADLLPRPTEPRPFYNVNFPHSSPRRTRARDRSARSIRTCSRSATATKRNGHHFYDGIYNSRRRTLAPMWTPASPAASR